MLPMLPKKIEGNSKKGEPSPSSCVTLELHGVKMPFDDFAIRLWEWAKGGPIPLPMNAEQLAKWNAVRRGVEPGPVAPDAGNPAKWPTPPTAEKLPALMKPSTGNMYEWIDYTWNPIKGACSHQCRYCYMRFLPGDPGKSRIVEKEFRAKHGGGNFLFVCSGCDLFAADIPDEWIQRTLRHCGARPENRYLFQSKNPARMTDHLSDMPAGAILCTTIESNRRHPEMGAAPKIEDRAEAMGELHRRGFDTAITIEPVMAFDIEPFVELVRMSGPDAVNIGANSKTRDITLPEPTGPEVEALISRISSFTRIKRKSNLKRLTDG